MAELPLLGLHEHVRDDEEIARLPRERLHPGVTYKVLWREAGSLAGVMWVAAGAVVPEHVHDSASHHVWVVDGRARTGDRELGRGSYWHVPAGIPHAVEGLEAFGCELFYLYLRGA